MKDLNMLVWLTQLGLGVVFSLGGCTLFGVWLRQRFELGVWVILVSCAVGFLIAMDGFRHSLKTLARMSKKNDPQTPTVSYNDHE